MQQALRTLTVRHPGWGFRKLHYCLRKNGLVINHKRTWRTCPRPPIGVGFTSHVLTDGGFRTLNVLDDYNRQLLGVEIDCSLPTARVVQALARLVECNGRLAQLRTDNGPEFISARLTEWCEAQAIVLNWIQPGKPSQYAYIECFNGSFRCEVLDSYLFRSLAHVRQLAGD